MRIRLLIAALALPFCFAPAEAQTPQQQENLKNLLNKKFGSPSRGVGRDDQQLKPEDYYWVKPDGSVQKAPAPPPVPPKRSSVDDPGTYTALFAGAWKWVKGLFGAKPKDEESPTATVGATRTPDLTPPPAPTTGQAPTAPAPTAQTQAPAAQSNDAPVTVMMAQAGAGEPVAVKRNSYIIQLKPDVTDAQIDAILTKYGLEVTKYDENLGWLYVSLKDSAKRSVAPGAGTDPKTLGQLLRPRIIKDLRQEPGVDAAFVNSGVKPNAVPSPVKTQSELNGVTYRWYWRTGATDDGNWGLKAMRMPPVWTILERYRKLHPESKPVKVAIVDSGFGKHSDLTYAAVSGGMPQPPFLANCRYSHGTHVAGIVAAGFGNKVGTDGVVPNSRIDAVPIGQDEPPPLTGAPDAGAVQPDSLFANVLQDTLIFLGSSLSDAESRGVVNFSLGFNWYAIGALKDKLPYEDEDIKGHIEDLGAAVRRFAYKFRNRALFVSAAGNDSGWLNKPLEARWATPFGWAATASPDNTQPSDNILVVEAIDRDGVRAGFSNIGGQVAAPGVDIMSTLTARQESYGMCSGTSQAAPHVAALAAILFELAPDKTPAEIARIIKDTAATPAPPAAAPAPAPAPAVTETATKASAPAEPAPPPSSSEYGTTPMGASVDATAKAAPAAAPTAQQVASQKEEPVREVDALEAVLKVSPDSIRYLADMNVDGKVDIADLVIIKNDLVAIETAKATGKPVGRDLNGDGEADDDENCWPLIDFNGSGKASYDVKKGAHTILGKSMSDLDVVEAAWTDKTKDFKTAMKETGLEDQIAEWRRGSALIAAATGPTRPKVPCE